MKNIFPHSYKKSSDMNAIAWFNGHFKSEKCFKLTIKEVKHT